MESEIELIRQAARGDKAAFESLFRANFQAVYNYALNLCGDSALAEDLTQETFIRTQRGLSRFGPPWKLRPWLFQIARNLLRDEIRRGRELVSIEETAAQLQDPQPGPEQTMLSMERRSRIRSALRRLPEHHREALILREFDRLSYAEIAATMGVSSEYVRVLIHRARAKFQENYALRLLAEEPLPACPVLLERLDAFQDKEPFTEEEENFIREHLRTCALCQHRQRELVAISALVGLGVPPPAPSGLEGRVLQRVRSAHRWRQFVPRALMLGLAATAALLVILLASIAGRALIAAAAASATPPQPSATFTPPSTSNVLFQTPTVQTTLSLGPAELITQTLTSPTQPDNPPAPPTLTFTPRPPTPVPDTAGPAITKFGHKPGTIYTTGSGACTPTSAVISATITDPSGIQSAVVLFAHTSFGSVPMSNTGGAVWSATLGPFSGAGDGTVDYQVRVFDNAGNRSDSAWNALTILACLK